MGFVAIAAAVSLMSGATVKDLAWMEGAWSCEKWGGVFEEHWTAPNGGTMLGVGRLIAGGKTSFMEFLSIEPSDKGLTMWIMLGSPSKGEKKGHPFALTSFTKDSAVFELPTNDFPSKITYRKEANGDLFCRIEGKQDGKAASEDFAFKPLGAKR